MLRSAINILVLITLVHGQDGMTDDRDGWEELFTIDSSHSIDLNIYSEIAGSITWFPINSTTGVAKARIFEKPSPEKDPVNLPLPKCNINTQVKDGKINVKIFPRIIKPVSISYQNNGGFHLLYSYVLTLCILTSVHGWKTAMTYGVLLSAMFTFADMCLSNITRVDIVIEYPEKAHFKKITLYMKDGNVTTIPNSMLRNTSISCATGQTNDTGCVSCCYGNGICGNDNKCHCSKGYDEKTHCKMKIVPRHTLYVNPIDKRIVNMKVSSNLNITAYGKRYTNGSLKALKSFQTHDLYHRALNIHMGKLRKISKVISSSGTTITFDWMNKCNVHTTVVFNQGQGQIDKDIKLCRGQPKTKPNLQKEKLLHVLPEETHHGSNRRLKNQAHITIPVKVKSCNEPDSSATLSATVTANNSSKKIHINEYLGTLTHSPGLYQIKLPVNPVIMDDNLKKTTCASFLTTSSHMCRYVSSNYYKFQRNICKHIRRSMNIMTEMTTAQFVDVISTCESGFQTLMSFCDEYYKSIEQDCYSGNIMFYDSFTPGNVSVIITAAFPGNYSVYSERFSLKVQENKQLTTETKIIRDIRPKPRFLGFSVHPRDPQPFEKYRVKINYACASTTTKVDMRIQGSDNYFSNVTCSGMTSCNCCILHVAGAAGLVMDKVKVALNDPLTQTVAHREIAVLF